jgi:MinD superfamily P-loop ATPase
MRQVAVLSGKGGTGKTSVVSAFSRLARRPVVVADCDVEAANLALTVTGDDAEVEPFFAGEKASVDIERCTGCAACEAVCRFDAV